MVPFQSRVACESLSFFLCSLSLSQRFRIESLDGRENVTVIAELKLYLLGTIWDTFFYLLGANLGRDGPPIKEASSLPRDGFYCVSSPLFRNILRVKIEEGLWYSLCKLFLRGRWRSKLDKDSRSSTGRNS